jgi:hypothetical protein
VNGHRKGRKLVVVHQVGAEDGVEQIVESLVTGALTFRDVALASRWM